MTAGNLRALAPGPTRRCDMRCGQRAFGVRSLGSWGEGRRIVQHESTATGLDAGGPGCTLRTVACGYALRWTGCHWMACKRSGVRIPIAPLVIPGQSAFPGYLNGFQDRLTVI